MLSIPCARSHPAARSRRARPRSCSTPASAPARRAWPWRCTQQRRGVPCRHRIWLGSHPVAQRQFPLFSPSSNAMHSCSLLLYALKGCSSHIHFSPSVKSSSSSSLFNRGKPRTALQYLREPPSGGQPGRRSRQSKPLSRPSNGHSSLAASNFFDLMWPEKSGRSISDIHYNRLRTHEARRAGGRASGKRWG
jgi:hypothetical protein